MTITEYLRVVRQNWLILVVCTVLGGLVGTIYTATRTPIYQARTQLFVSMSRGADVSDLTQGGAFAQQRVKSYADLVSTPHVLQPVIDRLQLPYTADDLAGRVQASSPLDTVMLEVLVSDAKPERARDIANAIVANLPATIGELETPYGESLSPVKVKAVKTAGLPQSPVSPNGRLNLAITLLLGLVSGLGLALARDAVDRSVKTKEEAQTAAKAPTLTVVADDATAAEHRLITHDAFSPRAEAFRQLRTNIRFLSVDKRVSALVVTSAVPGEGKTTTACNLAIALAQAGESVVLIDADLRRPTVADVFALSSGVGLTSVLLGDLPLDDALQTWTEDLPLQVLTSGPLPPNPSELIGSSRMATLISDLTGNGVTVVLDSPPLLPVTDAALLARATDGALVVARASSTHSEQLGSACDSLRITGATVLGVVLNRVPRRRSSSYYGGYDSYGGYSSRGTKDGRGAKNSKSSKKRRSSTPSGAAAQSAPAGFAMPAVPTTASLEAAPAPQPSTRVVLPAPVNFDTLPAIPQVPAMVDLEEAGERQVPMRPRRETHGRSRSRGHVNGHTPNGHPAVNGQASSNGFNGNGAADPASLIPGRWSPAERQDLDSLRPEPALPVASAAPVDPVADMIIDADRGTISRFEPTDTPMAELDSWHVEWGNLPALIASPRTEFGQNEQGNNGARHRN